MEEYNVHRPPKAKMAELKSIMTKMSIEVCCVTALPEFGVRWSEVSRAIRNARLPMTSGSIARVICRHVARSLEADEVDDIVAKLRLKLAATQSRTWHVIRMTERVSEEPVSLLTRCLPSRVRHALNSGRRNVRPEIQTTLLGDLMYISVQLVSEVREGSVLYVATPPGQDVALVSSLGMNTLIRACVQGLGFKGFTNANLYGRDIMSLLRISDEGWNENVEHLHRVPDYEPMPVITKNGIDYTNRTYDEQYVENVLGPNPPLLTDLKIETNKQFFDRTKLDKQINLRVQLKSEDVAKSLKSWVARGALAPTSDFFQIFHKIKSNKIAFVQDSD